MSNDKEGCARPPLIFEILGINIYYLFGDKVFLFCNAFQVPHYIPAQASKKQG